jgi:hypothetical protein
VSAYTKVSARTFASSLLTDDRGVIMTAREIYLELVQRNVDPVAAFYLVHQTHDPCTWWAIMGELQLNGKLYVPGRSHMV